MTQAETARMKAITDRKKLFAQQKALQDEAEAAARMWKAVYGGDVAPQIDGEDWQLVPVSGPQQGKLTQGETGQLGLDFSKPNMANAKMFGLSDEDMASIAQIAQIDPKSAMGMINEAFKTKLRGMKSAKQATPTGELANLAILLGRMPTAQEYREHRESIARAGATNVTQHGTSLEAAYDAQGNPVFIQPKKTGGVTPIEGYAPPKLVETENKSAAARDRAQRGLDLIAKARNHPGLSTATGISGKADPRNYIPGTDATNFRVLLEQMQGQTFLQAFESLKGGGQITEVEGQKATDSIARLNRVQSEEEFRAALNDLESILKKGLSRGVRPQSTQQPTTQKFTVTAPNGKNYSFPDQKSADNFRKQIGGK